MVEPKIRIDDEEAQRALRALGREAGKLAVEPMSIAAQWLAGQTAKRYLRGPRPERLTTDTGRLIGSIGSKVEERKGEIIGHVGTNVVSNTGFNYPEYWEKRGTRHGGPRPFLNPAKDELKQRWRTLFRNEYTKRLKEWLRAKRY